jgi:phosphate transport system permease protein
MTITSTPTLNPAPTPATASRRITSGRLPGWAPWALLGASALLSLLIFGIVAVADGAGVNIAGFLIVTALVYLVLITLISSVIEGRRKGVDRLVTGVVTTAFAIAMVPLLSVAWTVLSNGIAGLSAEFFTSSMRNVVGEGGGALHAIVGTLLVTLAAAIISIPIGLFTAIYLVEYGEGKRLARGITFLVDVMTGIPSIVAGLFAYALFALFFGQGVRLG